MAEIIEPPKRLSTPLQNVDEIIRQLTLDLIGSGLQTPFLAMDADQILASIARWKTHLPHVTPYYAVKANIDPLVLNLMFTSGLSADAASAFEVDVCNALQLPSQRLILSNPRKDADTIASIKQHRVWATTVDSEEEVEKLANAKLFDDKYNPILFIRIKVPTKGVKQDLSSKFGIRVIAPGVSIEQSRNADLQLDELWNVVQKANNAGFTRFGLAFHVGTQCADTEIYASAIQICERVGAALREDGLNVGWIDIGGGFADGSEAAEKLGLPPHEALNQLYAGVGQAAQTLLAQHYEVVAEPGRTLVADAGTLITQVIYDRTTNLTGRRIQIDDGVYRTMSGRVHDGRDFGFQAFRLGDHPQPFMKSISRFAVWGCSCDSFDKVADDIVLPADLGVGDFIAVPTMGAYSTSFGSNTNGFQPATIILYRRDNNRLIWEVSPAYQQNRLLLDHFRDWYSVRSR